jgi:hypothetical protein
MSWQMQQSSHFDEIWYLTYTLIKLVRQTEFSQLDQHNLCFAWSSKQILRIFHPQKKQLLLHVEFEVLTAVFMKSSIFWDLMSCSPLKVNRRFRGTCCLHLQSQRICQERNQNEEGSLPGGNMFSQNVTSTDYMVLYPRRQNSSESTSDLQLLFETFFNMVIT